MITLRKLNSSEGQKIEKASEDYFSRESMISFRDQQSNFSIDLGTEENINWCPFFRMKSNQGKVFLWAFCLEDIKAEELRKEDVHLNMTSSSFLHYFAFFLYNYVCTFSNTTV